MLCERLSRDRIPLSSGEWSSAATRFRILGTASIIPRFQCALSLPVTFVQSPSLWIDTAFLFPPPSSRKLSAKMLLEIPLVYHQQRSSEVETLRRHRTSTQDTTGGIDRHPHARATSATNHPKVNTHINSARTMALLEGVETATITTAGALLTRLPVRIGALEGMEAVAMKRGTEGGSGWIGTTSNRSMRKEREVEWIVVRTRAESDRIVQIARMQMDGNEGRETIDADNDGHRCFKGRMIPRRLWDLPRTKRNR